MSAAARGVSDIEWSFAARILRPSEAQRLQRNGAGAHLPVLRSDVLSATHHRR